jgi:hypothetical protein
MTSNRGPHELAAKWEEAWNSHDLDRILGLYSEDVILPAFVQCREKKAVFSGVNPQFVITYLGYSIGALI